MEKKGVNYALFEPKKRYTWRAELLNRCGPHYRLVLLPAYFFESIVLLSIIAF